jgi:hypothetical protein
MPKHCTGKARCAVLVWSLLAAISVPAAAQEQARFALDSAVHVDLFRGQNASTLPNVIVDVTATARLGGGWVAYVRPWLRQPRAPRWDVEIYQAAVQYQRPGRVATRLDAGYIASPIGLGMLETLPNLNPTVMPHLSYFTPLPTFDASAPRVQAIAASYPLGAQVTVSGTSWDARGAVVHATPTRMFVIGRRGNPASTPAVVVGGGVTPRVGLRIGGALARGAYASERELTDPLAGPRTATMTSVEVEYAFGHTRVAGELTHDRFDAAGVTNTAVAWFLQGSHALSPRWFVAGRHEGVQAPAAGSGTRATMHIAEATLGYRVALDVTLRGAVVSRKSFARTDWDQQAGLSVVWARRWW